MIDSRVYAAKNDKTGDVEFYYHQCPVCGNTNKLHVMTDREKAAGTEDFRCFSFDCGPKFIQLRIVNGIAVEVSRIPIFDTEGPGSEQQDSTMLNLAREVVADKIRIHHPGQEFGTGRAPGDTTVNFTIKKEPPQNGGYGGGYSGEYGI